MAFGAKQIKQQVPGLQMPLAGVTVPMLTVMGRKFFPLVLFSPEISVISHRRIQKCRNSLSPCTLGDPQIVQSALELFSSLLCRFKALFSGLYPRLAQELLKLQAQSAWVAQSVEHLTSAQVMISWFLGSSPTLGPVLTSQSLVPASKSVSPFPSAPHPLTLCLSLSLFLSVSKINIKKIQTGLWLYLHFLTSHEAVNKKLLITQVRYKISN